jgi:hypothetical protein
MSENDFITLHKNYDKKLLVIPIYNKIKIHYNNLTN